MKITRETTVLQRVEGQEKPILFTTQMGFDTEIPFEVALTFRPPGQDAVTWVLERDLFARGCWETEPVGEGDILVHTCSPGMIVHITLRDYTGKNPEANLHFSYTAVQQFLRDVGTASPADQIEPAATAAIDRLIDSILGEAGPA